LQRITALTTVQLNFSRLEGRSIEELTKPLTEEEKENTMALRKLKTDAKATAANKKARGGLAAEAMAADGKAAKAPKAEKKAKKQESDSHRGERVKLIDSMLDGTFTKREITAAVIKDHGGKEKSVLKLVNDRPFHMRKAGLNPSWKKEEKAAT
jgi:uncharacterized membrane protein YkoI